jgi:cell division protein FtsL
VKSKKNKKSQFLCNLEGFMIKIGVLVTVLLIIGIVCGQTSLAQINLDVQKLNKEVNNQKNTNKSLEMKIDEMTSLDRIKEISEEFGLSYNSDNIKTIK